MAPEERDIIDVLTDEHADLRSLLGRLQEAAPDERATVFEELVHRLASHEAAEEAVVHPLLAADTPDGQEVAQQVLAEESAAEDLLAEMTDLEPTSEDFGRRIPRLAAAVEQHASHEEAEEFPRLRVHVPEEQRRQVGRTFLQLRDVGPTRPHPHTPQNPTVRAALGPLVGAFDRARDAVRDARSQR